MIHSVMEIKDLINAATYTAEQIKMFIGKDHLEHCVPANITIDLNVDYITVNYWVPSGNPFKDNWNKKDEETI